MKEQVLQGEQMWLNAPRDRLFIPPQAFISNIVFTHP